MNQRNYNLDILRVMAAIMVFSIHLGSVFKWQITGFGMYGVQLFFMISGYLAFSTFERDGKIFKRYIKNRIIRIVPMYYLALALMWLIDFSGEMLKGESVRTVLSLNGVCGVKWLRYFFFLNAILPTEDYALWNNRYALWFMSSVMVFYVLTLFLYKWIKTWCTSIWCTVFAIGINYTMTVLCKRYAELGGQSEIVSQWRGTPMFCFYSFMLGIMIYYAIKEKKCFISSVLLITALLLGGYNYYKYEIVFCFIMFVALLERGESVSTKGKWLIKLLAECTFPLYLCHQCILTNGMKMIKIIGISMPIIQILVLVVACCIGTLMLVKCDRIFRTKLMNCE